MDNPLVKKDLIDAILELREEIERRLKASKYYVAMNKLDELLDAIRPLEIIEGTAKPAAVASAEAQAADSGDGAPAYAEPEAPAYAEPEAAPEPEREPEGERVWTGVVQETVNESWQPAPAEASGEELRAS